MTKMPRISTANLVSAKRSPIEVISNNNMGILVVDQAPMKIITLRSEEPFLIKTAANGKAPYNGPAANEPSKNAISAPLTDDFPRDSAPSSHAGSRHP